MRILIVGAGIVGANLAGELTKEGHDISLIEQDSSVLRRLADKLDILLVNGNGASQKTLIEAGIGEVEMLIAVTANDEANIVICNIARGFKVARKIARVRNSEYVSPDSVIDPVALGVDILVNPDEAIVNSLVKIVETPGATDVAEFVNGRILLRGFKVPKSAPISGKRISELKDASTLDSFLIAAIARGEKLIIPRSTDVINAGDTIFVLIAEETVPLFLPFINRQTNDVRSVVILSASNIGRLLAKRLEAKIERITLIEPSEEQAENAAAQLAKTIVINGEATDRNILKQAGAPEADYFVAASNNDEENLLASLLAREIGARRTAAITQNPDYISILESIGIDVVMNPGLVTASKILQFVRKGRIMSLVKLHESEAEIIEIEADPKSRIAGKKLKDVDYPDGAIVGAIFRDDAMIIPNGETEIRPGERVVILARPDAIPAVERLFSRKRLFG